MCPEHPTGLVLKDTSPLPRNTKKPLCLGLALETGILSVWGYDIGFEVSMDDSNVHPGLKNTVRVQKEGQAYLRSLGALNYSSYHPVALPVGLSTAGFVVRTQVINHFLR